MVLIIESPPPHRPVLALSRITPRPQINLVDSAEAVDSACAEGMTVTAKHSESGCVVGVSRAPGDKCERCWYQCDSVGSHADHPSLCSRCHGIVEGLGLAPPPAAAVAEPEAVSAA